MKLIIVRHGETNEILQGILQGQTDCTLSSNGLKQALKLADSLKNEKVDLIYCSDLGRCKQSLEPLIKLLGNDVIYTKLLRERGKGIFEGKLRIDYQKWKALNPGLAPEGGESEKDVDKRVEEFLGKNIDSWSNKTVLIMAHGGPIASLLKSLLGRDHEMVSIIEKGGGYTAISIVKTDKNGKNILEQLYSTKHLGDLK